MVVHELSSAQRTKIVDENTIDPFHVHCAVHGITEEDYPDL